MAAVMIVGTPPALPRGARAHADRLDTVVIGNVEDKLTFWGTVITLMAAVRFCKKIPLSAGVTRVDCVLRSSLIVRMAAELDPKLLPLAGTVLLAFTTGAATGTGSIVIALSLGLYLYPLHRLLPVLVLLDTGLSAYLVSRHYRHIGAGWLFVRILPLMGLGLALGLAVFAYAAQTVLRVLFGGFVVALALVELNRLLRPRAFALPALSAPVRAAGLLGAGVTHGLFASGGPLLVYVLGRSNLHKGNFRSTLAAVWLVLNTVLCVTYLLTGRITAAVWLDTLLLLPVVPPAIAAGEWVHRRLDERRFRVTVFGLLALSGVSLLASR